MAAPDRSLYKGNKETHNINQTAAASLVMDLPATTGGLCHIIDSVWLYALGTITAFDLLIENAAGADICRIGGQVNAGALSFHQPVTGPVVCFPDNATKITFTATGATSIALGVHCHRE